MKLSDVVKLAVIALLAVAGGASAAEPPPIKIGEISSN